MVNDVSTAAKTLGGIVEFNASYHKDGYEEKSFKEVIHKMKVGKTGYVYLIKSDGTLLIHPKKERKNLKNTDYGTYITSHKKGGTFEYITVTTGQEKLAAFEYIPIWDAYIVLGVDKADYFDDINANFIQYFSVLIFIFTSLLLILNYFTGKTVLNNARIIQKVSYRLGSGDGDLTQSISILTTKDEFRNISINMNAFLEKIHGSIVSIKSNSHYQSILANELTNLTHLLREKTTESGDTATTTM
ncbi:MAG: hypothetical protein SPLUMA1_SPLUMAMAG1_01042 [uncultured Sulfurimonas sp.]|nr:MAG: hypothetical protein SPLUMA1_SPLUMAMAG1_01042 [uncultured Sulfurimonas sp.]